MFCIFGLLKFNHIQKIAYGDYHFNSGWCSGWLPCRQDHERRWFRIPSEPFGRYCRRYHRRLRIGLARNQLGRLVRNTCYCCNRCRNPALDHFALQEKIGTASPEALKKDSEFCTVITQCPEHKGIILRPGHYNFPTIGASAGTSGHYDTDSDLQRILADQVSEKMALPRGLPDTTTRNRSYSVFPHTKRPEKWRFRGNFRTLRHGMGPTAYSRRPSVWEKHLYLHN